jgi:uncharacterized protein (TIGR00369 family)
MSADATEEASTLVEIPLHRHCVVCGSSNDRGLHLEFVREDDGSVTAVFDCDNHYQGYPNVLHGGVVSSLLDGAMTNCLFAHGRSGLTAELNVRFRHPVATDTPLVVRAWIEESYRHLHRLNAECSQNGTIMATASGKFMEPPKLSQGDCGIC